MTKHISIFVTACMSLSISFAQEPADSDEIWVPTMKEWNEDMNQRLCEFSSAIGSEDAYLYSEAFIYLADASGAIPPPEDGKYNTRRLDQSIVKRFIEQYYSRLTCDDGRHFLSVAFEIDNRDILNDLLELSSLFYNGSQYEYWHYDFTETEAAYNGEERKSLISFLENSVDHSEKAAQWLNAIDRHRVRTLKYIYETNSMNIMKYLVVNKASVVNRSMDYGSNGKNTFLGFVDAQPDSDQKKAWLDLLRKDPAKIKLDK